MHVSDSISFRRSRVPAIADDSRYVVDDLCCDNHGERGVDDMPAARIERYHAANEYRSRNQDAVGGTDGAVLIGSVAFVRRLQVSLPLLVMAKPEASNALNRNLNTCSESVKLEKMKIGHRLVHGRRSAGNSEVGPKGKSHCSQRQPCKFFSIRHLGLLVTRSIVKKTVHCVKKS